MKKLFFIAALFTIAFTDCKKAKGPASVPSVQLNNGLDSLRYLSCLVNGRDWKTDSAFSYKVKQSGNDSGIINLMIEATLPSHDTATSASTILININNYTGPTIYYVNPPINSITYYQGTMRHLATSGTFRVISDTGQILIGTFSFAADTVKVTNGNFQVTLP
jgi:hypothetical protein